MVQKKMTWNRLFILKRTSISARVISCSCSYQVEYFETNPGFSLRLLCTGAIPFLFLSYINLRIYSRIRQNSQSSVRFTSFLILIIFVSILTLISKRNRSISAKKAGNLATILILIGDLSFDNHTI